MTCVCQCAYLPCFCGLNPRTVPQLSLNKFRAHLGYRGLVLGLNVSCFFRSLGTSSGEHVQSKTRPSGSRRHNYVTKKLRAPVSVSAFFFFFFLAVAVDLDVVLELKP